MNNYLLYEIGVEEMPSRFVESTLGQLKNNLTKALTEKRVGFSEIETYATPRRLVLVVKKLASHKQMLVLSRNGNINLILFIKILLSLSDNDWRQG